MEIISRNENETFELGRSMGQLASAGMIIALDGDLGAGKTVFSKGFACGLNVDDVICSPTFTIIHEYESGRLPLYHFDVYRIEEPEEMYELGYEEYFYGEGVCLVEWASIIEELVPPEAIHIVINRDIEEGSEIRRIFIDKDIDI